MITGRLSSRREFTPVPSCGSVFVYMIPKQNVMPARVIPARVHPGSCAGARFSSRHENSFRRAPINTALCKHGATFHLAPE